MFGINALLLYVEDKLVKQNKKCFEDGLSLYRSSTGLKCGVGFLIPDVLYKEAFEENPACSLPSSVFEHIQNTFKINRLSTISALVTDIQYLHDIYIEDFESNSFRDHIKLHFKILHETYSGCSEYTT